MIAKVDLRCPRNPMRLFGRVVPGSGGPGDSAFEVACDDCRKNARRAGEAVALVLHLFDQDGVCTETYSVAPVASVRRHEQGPVHHTRP